MFDKSCVEETIGLTKTDDDEPSLEAMTSVHGYGLDSRTMSREECRHTEDRAMQTGSMHKRSVLPGILLKYSRKQERARADDYSAHTHGAPDTGRTLSVGNRKVKFDSKVNYLPREEIGVSIDSLSKCIKNECKDGSSCLNGDKQGWKIVQRSRKGREQKSG